MASGGTMLNHRAKLGPSFAPLQTKHQNRRRVIQHCESQPAPPLYTTFSVPVYSLSTAPANADASSPRRTMNLTTYASAVSISPERCFALSLYLGTQSHKNFMETKRGVLQVLCHRHTDLFTILGKTTGAEVEKLQMIKEAGFELTERFGCTTLERDHDVVICKIKNYWNKPGGPHNILYTADLKKLGLLK
eukprot:gene18908-25467_t